jgi:hypothetical protein
MDAAEGGDGLANEIGVNAGIQPQIKCRFHVVEQFCLLSPYQLFKGGPVVIDMADEECWA